MLLAMYLVGVAVTGWLYFALGTGRMRVPAMDRVLLALPAGGLIVALINFLFMWPLGIPLTPGTVLLSAVVSSVLLLVAVRPAMPRLGIKLAAVRQVTRVRRASGIAAVSPLPDSMFWRSWLDRPGVVLVGLGGLVLTAFFLRLMVVRLQWPIMGGDFYLYHWHFARALYQNGGLPLNVSPSYFEYQYASPPLVFMLYAQFSHLVGALSQIGPRLFPLLFAAGTAVVAGRIARVSLGLSIPASICAAAFALWSGYYRNGLLEESTDTAGTFFSVAAGFWLLRRDLSPWSRILGGGLLLAGAYWCRYDGLGLFGVLPLVVLAGALLEARAGRRWKQEVGVAVGGALVGLVLISPHLAHNLTQFGNPVYPAFALKIGGRLVDAWSWENTLRFSSAVPFYGLPPHWWLRPLHYLWETGPSLVMVFAAAVPALARLRRGDSRAAQLVLACALWTGFSLVFLRIPDDGDAERHLLLVTALAGPLFGLVIDQLVRWSRTAVLCFILLTVPLAWYVLDNHVMAFQSANLLVILMLAVILGITWRWRRQEGVRRGPRYELAALFALPFLVFSVTTWGRPNPEGMMVSDGLLSFPEARVLAQLKEGERYLTFEDRREQLAGEPLPGDHPVLETFYQRRLGGWAGAGALKALGVRYIYWYEPSLLHPLHPSLMDESPLYAELANPLLFKRLYWDEKSKVAVYEIR
jgi:hypothetical protein